MSAENEEITKSLYQPKRKILFHEKESQKTILIRSFIEKSKSENLDENWKFQKKLLSEEEEREKEKEKGKLKKFETIKDLVRVSLDNMKNEKIAEIIKKGLEINKDCYERQSRERYDYKHKKIELKKNRSSIEIIRHSIDDMNYNDKREDNQKSIKEKDFLQNNISKDLLKSDLIGKDKEISSTSRQERTVKKFSNVNDSFSENDDLNSEYIPSKLSINPYSFSIIMWNNLISVYYMFIIIVSSLLLIEINHNNLNASDYFKYFLYSDLVIYINIFLTLLTGTNKRNLISYSILYKFSQTYFQIITQILSSLPFSLIVSVGLYYNSSTLPINDNKYLYIRAYIVFVPKLLLVLLFTKWVKLSYIFKENNNMFEFLLPFIRKNIFFVSSINFIGKIKGFLCMITYFFLIAHICSCIMILLGQYLEFSEENTWIKSNYLNDKSKFDYMEIYFLSFYFIISTLITVGYGDIIATNIYERIFCIVLLILGCLFYSYIITTISFIFKNQNEYLQIYNEKKRILDDIRNVYLIDNSLYKIIHRNLECIYKNGDMERKEFLKSLPKVTKNELTIKMFSKKILKLDFFRNLIKSNDFKLSMNVFINKKLRINHNLKSSFSYYDEKNNFHYEDFLLFVIPYLNRYVYYRSENLWIYNQIVNEMFMVISGKVNFSIGYKYQNYSICSLGRNKNYGEVLMFSDKHLSSFDIIASSKKTEIFTLEKKDFHIINYSFPEIIMKIMEKSTKNHIEIESLRTIAIEYYKVNLTFEGFSKIVKSIYYEEISNHIIDSIPHVNTKKSKVFFNYDTKLDYQILNKSSCKDDTIKEDNVLYSNGNSKNDTFTDSLSKESVPFPKKQFLIKTYLTYNENGLYTNSNGHSSSSFNGNMMMTSMQKTKRSLSILTLINKSDEKKKMSIKLLINKEKAYQFDLKRRKDFKESRFDYNENTIIDDSPEVKRKKFIYQSFLYSIYNNKRRTYNDNEIINKNIYSNYDKNNGNNGNLHKSYMNIRKFIVKHQDQIRKMTENNKKIDDFYNKVISIKAKIKIKLKLNTKTKSNTNTILNNILKIKPDLKNTNKTSFLNNQIKPRKIENRIRKSITNNSIIYKNEGMNQLKTKRKSSQKYSENERKKEEKDLSNINDNIFLGLGIRNQRRSYHKEKVLEKRISNFIRLDNKYSTRNLKDKHINFEEEMDFKKRNTNKNIKDIISTKERNERSLLYDINKNIRNSYHLENDKNVEEMLKEYLNNKKKCKNI